MGKSKAAPVRRLNPDHIPADLHRKLHDLATQIARREPPPWFLDMMIASAVALHERHELARVEPSRRELRGRLLTIAYHARVLHRLLRDAIPGAGKELDKYLSTALFDAEDAECLEWGRRCDKDEAEVVFNNLPGLEAVARQAAEYIAPGPGRKRLTFERQAYDPAPMSPPEFCALVVLTARLRMAT